MRKIEWLLAKYKKDLERAGNTVAQKQQEFYMAQGILMYLQQEVGELQKQINQEGGKTE